MSLDFTFHYKILVQNKLIKIFSEDKIYTDEMVIEIKNEAFRDWLIEFSMNSGYVPVMSNNNVSGYVIVSFIRRFTPC